jgi:hypothetical protein
LSIIACAGTGKPCTCTGSSCIAPGSGPAAAAPLPTVTVVGEVLQRLGRCHRTIDGRARLARDGSGINQHLEACLAAKCRERRRERLGGDVEGDGGGLRQHSIPCRRLTLGDGRAASRDDKRQRGNEQRRNARHTSGRTQDTHSPEHRAGGITEGFHRWREPVL